MAGWDSIVCRMQIFVRVGLCPLNASTFANVYARVLAFKRLYLRVRPAPSGRPVEFGVRVEGATFDRSSDQSYITSHDPAH